MNRFERQLTLSFEEDLKRKLILFHHEAKPCYDAMIQLRERYMNPTCVIDRNGVVTKWQLPASVEVVMEAYRKHVKEIWYMVFGFEMEES